MTGETKTGAATTFRAGLGETCQFAHRGPTQKEYLLPLFLAHAHTHTHTHKQACILVTRQWGRGGLEIIFNCYKWRRGTLPLLLRISLPFCSPLAQPRRRERVSDANLQQSQARTRRATQRYTQHDLKNQRRSWQHCFRVLCVGRHVNGSMKTTASARRNEWGEKPLFRFLLFLSVVV
jgi:hypothetical protein